MSALVSFQFLRRAGLLLALGSVLSLSAAADLPKGMTGTWTFVPDRSTDLSPWRACTLSLSLDGDHLSIERQLKWGRRVHEENLTVDLGNERTVAPVGWWVDNRHIGAYAPHNADQVIRPTVVDDGKVLRLDIDLPLETQQGTRQVNVLRQFQLSPDGNTLTVIDLRSTRPRPVVHVFQRTSE